MEMSISDDGEAELLGACLWLQVFYSGQPLIS